MIKIRLPWPDSALSPNSRKKWRKIEATEVARNLAFSTVRNLGYYVLPMTAETLQMSVIAYPPDRRCRDLDNVLASCKAYQDGFCLAMDVDDGRIKRATIEWGECVPGGEIVMQLEEL